MSLSGDRFFYPNVLESAGQHRRQAWFGCACCPSNISRFIPSVPGYVYAKTNDEIYVNIYLDNIASIEKGGSRVEMVQKTNYPWDGDIEITVNPDNEEQFAIKLRIPGWVRGEAIPGNLYSFMGEYDDGIQLSVNGKKVKVSPTNGFATIKRKWKKGDIIKLILPMPVKKVIADERIEADMNKFSLQRGPLMYCAEWADNPDGQALSLVFDPTAEMDVEYREDMLGGAAIIKTMASPAKKTLSNDIILGESDVAILIPYHLWNNRGPGEMKVWLPDTAASARPVPAPTIASRSKITASKMTSGLTTVNDQYEPKNSNDHEWSYYHWWPDNNSWEWVQYDFEETENVSRVKIYWFDDRPGGGCRIPDAWELYFMENGAWLPVKAITEYTITKDDWDVLDFEPVNTTALRLRVKLSQNFSSGIHEWIVE